MLLIAVSACSTYESAESERLVVDGWIDADGYPVVMVSSTLQVNTEEISKRDLNQHIKNWARVSINDGEKEEVLIGKRDDRYFPPFIYTTSRMRGEVGKRYTLNVYSDGESVTAQTSIPGTAGLENIRAVKAKGADTLYDIVATLKGLPEDGTYYKVFVKVEGRDSIFMPSLFGNFDNSDINAEGTIKILPSTTQKWSNYDTFFHSGDKVRIKFCSMDGMSYRYWCDYEEILTLARNPLFPVTRQICSNIDGGLGLWAGYGASFYTLTIP